MPRVQKSQPARSPSSPEEWVGGLVRLPSYVEGQPPYRPYLAAWMSSPDGELVAQEVLGRDPDSTVLARLLSTACTAPMTGKPRRPSRVRVEDDAAAGSIRAQFAGLQVVVAPAPEFEVLAEFLRKSINDPGSEHWELEAEPTYLEDGRIAPESVGRFFLAAARLYEAAPWDVLLDSDVLAIDAPEFDVNGACMSILGAAEETFGFVLFPSAEIYREFVDRISESEDDEMPPLPNAVTFSVHFSSADELPGSMRAEVEKFGWPLASPDTYPTILWLDPDGVPRPLGEAEIRLMTACAEALAGFLGRHREELEEEMEPKLSELVEVDLTPPVRIRISAPHPEVPWEEEFHRLEEGEAANPPPNKK